MESEKKFGLLRQVLRTIGLSREAADDIVNWIVDLLVGESEKDEGKPSPEFPYQLRPHFLSAAESKFYDALRTCVGNQATIQCKVGLRDLFEVNAEDQSRQRIYTNKIDRKHVDFVCCDPVTMRPLYAIELDDRSHQRADRQARDVFVDGVFKAGRLPLIHIPVKSIYVQADLQAQLASVTNGVPNPQQVSQVTSIPAVPSIVAQNAEPVCPKCGGKMILRTAKSGSNAGNQFWGCAEYPQCKSMLPYKPAGA